MYDTYMSEEAFDNLTAGDEVTVRSLDDLIHDFGADINVPCGWSSDMDELCGQTLIVDYVERDQIIDFGILHTKNCGWSFSRQMLEPKEYQGVSQEEISELLESMILGGNDDKKQ